MSKSDWKRGASESRQQIELLRARWPKAFPAKGHEVRPLANAASAIAEALGWSQRLRARRAEPLGAARGLLPGGSGSRDAD